MSMRSSILHEPPELPALHVFHDLTDDRIHITLEGAGGYLVDVPLDEHQAVILARAIFQTWSAGNAQLGGYEARPL